MDEKGIQPALKLEVGQTQIAIDATRDPVKVKTKNGDSTVFHLTQPLGVDLWASEYLYQVVVSFLDDCAERGIDVSNPIPCKITRTGTGKNDTRYSIDLV